MKESIRKKLVKLNQLMYEEVSDEFSDSRSFHWEGWDLVTPYIPRGQGREISVLDVGCGNGRFGCFLKETKHIFEYTGIDVSYQLLRIAEKRLNRSGVNVTALIAGDISENLDIVGGSYDVIVLFGVLHHIPDHKHREQLIRGLGGCLNKSGLLIFTTWNFLVDQRLVKRLIDPKALDIKKSDLEIGDHLMRWSRGTEMLRYVHAFDAQEVDRVISLSGLEEIASFQADGKTGSLNDYHILQKKGLP